MQTEDLNLIEPPPAWLRDLMRALDSRLPSRASCRTRDHALWWLVALERDGPGPTLHVAPTGVVRLIWDRPGCRRAFHLCIHESRSDYIEFDDDGRVCDQGSLGRGNIERLRRGVAAVHGDGRRIDIDGDECEGKGR